MSETRPPSAAERPPARETAERPPALGAAERPPDGCPPRSRPGYDLTRHRFLAGWIRRRSWHFQLILPNQVLFWAVIVIGFVGVADFDLNIASTLTWFVWFSLVFVMITVTGRGWCAVCPFGGLAEWIQRGRLWHGRTRHRTRLVRARPVPGWLSRYGYVPTAFTFGLLTWLEEYFGVSDGTSPARTSWTVLGIIAVALITFLAFERRTFCRHLCPLGGLIGTLGAGAPVAGFRARDRDVCRSCTTRECLHGSDRSYGCPWFNWPGGADTNVNCGLCGECFRSCPSDNVGLFVDKPFAGLLRPRQRRGDVAWTVAVIAGIMAHQHLHTTPEYARAEAWLNGVTGLPHGPNPLLFVTLTAVCTLGLAAPSLVLAMALYRPPAGGLPGTGGSFTFRTSPFRVFFVPLAYAAIPLLAADFVGVELVAFVTDSPKAVAAVGRTVGMDPQLQQGLGSMRLLGTAAVVRLQVALLLIGGLASTAIGWRVSGDEARGLVRTPALVRAVAAVLLALAGGLVVLTYVVTQGQAG